MNKNIMRALGFGNEVAKVEAGRCPFCGKQVNIADFRDDCSIRECSISGLCQACQDDTFTDEP
jgi:hypothetical protein